MHRYNDSKIYNLISKVLVSTGGTGPTETLVVGVDDQWMAELGYGSYNSYDVSCATANNNPYCLQGIYIQIEN